ncbi:MAG: MFS transporter, partial [Defluviitaleaceae bacterium]|nr:MFS transporter [Defluviitaleaceae bacterium]
AQIFVGYLTDRFGGARVLLWSGLFFSLGSLLFPFAATAGELHAARALVGIGASGLYLAIVKEITLLYPPHRFSSVLGMYMFVGYAGGFAATWPLERAAQAAMRTAVEKCGGWRSKTAAPPGLCLTVLVSHFAGLFHPAC